jgi:hypothetical protein
VTYTRGRDPDQVGIFAALLIQGKTSRRSRITSPNPGLVSGEIKIAPGPGTQFSGSADRQTRSI